MIAPADDIELGPNKPEEEKDRVPSLHQCDLYDADIVHKIAQEFLPGLASACIDNTTGALFSNPASVAVDIRREMVDYLIQRTESFVAETLLLEGGQDPELSDDPYDIISNLIDDFATSKRNFLSTVSGWVLSERREDRIDDFVQEMEINGFWLMNRRESVAQTVLKNIDFKNLYHCSMKFKSLEELECHKWNCGFRTVTCGNEGCDYRFSAAQMEQHDSICLFKVLKCEQKCEESIMRREMDRHCITVCPMKLVKCPFYSVGCHDSVPQSRIEQHRFENLGSHLVYILQGVHKDGLVEDLKERVEELCKLSSPEELAEARDARALAFAIKDLEAKLGPLKVKTTPNSNDEVTDSTDKNDESTLMATKEVNSPTTKGENVKSPPKCSDLNDPDHEKEKLQDLKESPLQKEDNLGSPNKVMDKSVDKKVAEPSEDEHLTSPIKVDVSTSTSIYEKEKHAELANEDQESTKSSPREEEPKELSNPEVATFEAEDVKS